MAEGRVVAIRVTDADFEVLEQTKKELGCSWNELLLQPLESRYNVTLQSARRPEKEQPEKPKKTGKSKKAEPVGEEPVEEPVPDPPWPKDVPGE